MIHPLRWLVLLPVAIIAIIAIVGGSAASPQQAVKVLPTPIPSPTPLIAVHDADGRSRPLGIKEAEVAVTLHGQLAKTAVTLTFYNDTDRVLEGDLDFPLPDGAALSGYALDIDGAMVEAVPVPRREARVIVEKEIRKGVDPGLIEQTAGNNFRTRLYPIPAKNTRTIRVEFVSQAITASNGDLRVLVPLRWNQMVPLLRLSIASDAPTRASLGGRERDLLSDGSRHIKTLEDIRVDDDLLLTVNSSESPAIRTGVIIEPFTKASGITETYFAVVDGPQSSLSVTKKRATPHHIGLIWDASLSRRHADISRELRLVALIAKNQWFDTTVDLRVVRDRAESIRRFVVTNGDATELIAYLKAQPLDGGTDLGALPWEDSGAGYTVYNYWLTFTDGLDTLGGDRDRIITERRSPVFAIGTDSNADHALLRWNATRTGGDYINLTTDPRSEKQIAQSIGEPPYSLLSVHVDEGEVRDLIPSGIVAVQAGNGISIAGRLVSDTAKLTLHYGYPDGNLDRTETATRTVMLRKADRPVVSSGLVGALWAQKQAEALSISPESNRDALAALGRDYHIVTPGSSLLVLETLEQHLQYGIAPAPSRKALYAAYVKAVESQGLVRREEEKGRLDFALARWKERIRWWNTEFKYASNFRYGETITGKGRARASAPVSLAAEAGGSAGRGEIRVVAPMPLRAAEGSIQVRARGGAGATIETATVAHATGAPALRTGRLTGTGASNAGGTPNPLATKIDAGESDDEGPAVAITIKEWTPDASYLKAMTAAKTVADAYAAYLRERETWSDAPAFYFDCAEELHRRGANDLAVRVLTSIADLRLEEPALLRIVAYRLEEWGYPERAIPLFEKVVHLRPEEPQSFRDLALVLAQRGDAVSATSPNRAIDDYNRALQLLNTVAIGHWDRFEGITDIAVNEANDIIVHARRLPEDVSQRLVIPLDPRLIKNMACDLRVVMTWDSDNSDMDLHVIEPSNEECFYDHNRTTIGGRLSDDFTQGYGPEEYLVRRGMKGTYEIRSNYFGSQEQRLSGGTTIRATLFTDWGRPTEKRQSISLRLTTNKETITIGKVTLRLTR